MTRQDDQPANETGSAGPLEALRSKVAAYADWVRQLREGRLPQPLVTGEDPLARLGEELAQLAHSVTERERQLRNLLELVQTAEQGVLLDEVLDKLFDGFAGIIPFERIGCAFLSEDISTVVAYWARSTLGPIQIAAGYAQRIHGSTLEEVLRTRQPRIINDLPAYLESKRHSDSTRRIVAEGGRASLTCPLYVHGRPTGFLFFTSGTTGTYQERHPVIFGQISAQVALVIEKARMYERLVSHNETLVEQTQRLEAVADTDPLTGLLNRRAIERLLESAWARRRNDGTQFGIIIADVDHFKRVNDTYGHVVGDVVLQEVATRLRAGTRKNDVVGRYGGEEFVVLLPDATGELLLQSAERLRWAIAAGPFERCSGNAAVTASFGCASSLGPFEAPQDVLAAADGALYQAKHLGRNRCALHPEPHE